MTITAAMTRIAEIAETGRETRASDMRALRDHLDARHSAFERAIREELAAIRSRVATLEAQLLAQRTLTDQHSSALGELGAMGAICDRLASLVAPPPSPPAASARIEPPKPVEPEPEPEDDGAEVVHLPRPDAA